MWTLVIHAPDYRVKRGAKSFTSVLNSGVGDGYAISISDKNKLLPGSKVVLIRKNGIPSRAEGNLVRLAPTGRKTTQGIVRYDVYCSGLKPVPYKTEKLNRFGIAVY